MYHPDTPCREWRHSAVDSLHQASSTGDVQRVQDAVYHLLAPALSDAVANGQVDAAAFLLDKGAKMTQKLFTQAAQCNHRGILGLFLERGWDINTPESMSMPPALAWTYETPGLTEWFLDHGADPNARYEYDLTPLSWAICDASFSCIKLLLARGGSIQHGQLLHHAAMRKTLDRREVMQYLLDMGCGTAINKIMYQDLFKDYFMNMYSAIGAPLHYAAAEGLLDLVQLLVNAGADPLLKCPRKMIALDWAKMNGHAAVIDFLRPLSTASSAPRNDFVDLPGNSVPKPSKEVVGKLNKWTGLKMSTVPNGQVAQSAR